MAIVSLRIDIQPYFKSIADYYWDYLDAQVDGSIWDWLGRDYGIVKIGARGSKPECLVAFPDEAHMSAFLLRWS